MKPFALAGVWWSWPMMQLFWLISFVIMIVNYGIERIIIFIHSFDNLSLFIELLFLILLLKANLFDAFWVNFWKKTDWVNGKEYWNWWLKNFIKIMRDGERIEIIRFWVGCLRLVYRNQGFWWEWWWAWGWFVFCFRVRRFGWRWIWQ
jgi:hypothetical protein